MNNEKYSLLSEEQNLIIKTSNIMRLILAVALSIVYANAVSCCGETQKEDEKFEDKKVH